MFFTISKRVNIDEIIIPDDYSKKKPGTRKLIRKTAEFIKTGKLDKIYVSKDLTLFDGYCSYLIYKALGYETVKIIKVKEKKEKKIGF